MYKPSLDPCLLRENSIDKLFNYKKNYGKSNIKENGKKTTREEKHIN